MESDDVFDDVLFIRELSKTDVIDFKKTPYLRNHHGRAAFDEERQGNLIDVLPEDAALDLGQKYTNIRAWPERVPAGYEITEFDFGAKEVRYAPLTATRDSVRAFGMTLLMPGECIRMDDEALIPPGCGPLICATYQYGKWAGHWSPYRSLPHTRQLITFNPTDLEYHDFPHVFFSMDDVPLVISVARWRPYANEIALADLWVTPGDAIILPPKRFPTPPEGGDTWHKVIDLHGNRNSALATWHDKNRRGVMTQTLLVDPANGIHYHEEIAPTVHATSVP
jgi:hypothetical protein